MGKYRKFLINLGALTIGNFGSKILVFLMIPLYTNVLTVNEYGIFDIFITTINLLIPILSQNINEALLRFLFDKDKDEVISVAIKYNIISIILIIILILINKIFCFSNIMKEYSIYFILLYFLILMYNYFTSLLRGINRIKILSIAGVINTICIIGFSIIFLLIIKNGLKGYFMSYIISYIITIIYIFIVTDEIKDFKINYSHFLAKEMLNYSRPFILNTIGWWINNTSDRYIITMLCGVAANGIYSVAYKIPSILVMFQNIFLQAWQISAIEEYETINQNNFYSTIYNIYNSIIVLTCSLLIILTKIIAKFLYAKEFYIAWNYVPFLLISVVFGALAGYIGGIFTAAKASQIFSLSTLIGALINIILNFVLVWKIGPMGAAISTCISYIIVWLIRIKQIEKYICIRIFFFRDIRSYVILFLQSFLIICVKIKLMYLIQIILFIFIFREYRKEIGKIINIFKKGGINK